MRASFLNVFGAVAGIVLAGATLVRGDILYQNTAVDSGINLNFANNQQIGQQIWLGSATPEYLTNFSFEYYSPVLANSFSGNVMMDVIIYANDSGSTYHGYTIPGTILYNSGLIPLVTPFSQNGNSFATANFDLSDLLNGVGQGLFRCLPPCFFRPISPSASPFQAWVAVTRWDWKITVTRPLEEIMAIIGFMGAVGSF